MKPKLFSLLIPAAIPLLAQPANAQISCLNPSAPTGGGRVNSPAQEFRFRVSAPQGCSVNVSVNTPFFTVKSGGSGVGSRDVVISIPQNLTQDTRYAIVNVNATRFEIVQSPYNSNVRCPIRVSPSRLDFGTAIGGGLRLTVETNPECSHAITGSDSWIKADRSTIFGSGTIGVPNPGRGRSGNLVIGDVAVPVFTRHVMTKAKLDMDRDGIDDPGTVRHSDWVWYPLTSSMGCPIGYSRSIMSNREPACARQFGLFDDVAIVADFDGDGAVETAIYRRWTGEWMFLPSTGVKTCPSSRWNYVPEYGLCRLGGLGGWAEQGLALDIDGSGRAVPVVFNPTGGFLMALPNQNSCASPWRAAGVFNGMVYCTIKLGQPGDIAVKASLTGKGDDILLFRPSKGEWHYVSPDGKLPEYFTKSYTTEGRVVGVAKFGQPGDTALTADINSDGKSDLVLYRNGTYIALPSTPPRIYSPAPGSGLAHSASSGPVGTTPSRVACPALFTPSMQGPLRVCQREFDNGAGVLPRMADYDADGQADLLSWVNYGKGGAEFRMMPSTNLCPARFYRAPYEVGQRTVCFRQWGGTNEMLPTGLDGTERP